MARSPSIAIYDTGIGAVQVTQECALLAPAASFLFVADREMSPTVLLSGREIRARLAALRDALSVREVDVLVPAGSFTWPYLDELTNAPFHVVDPLPALRRVLGERIGSTVGVLASRPMAESRFLYTGGVHDLVVADASRLAALVERSFEPDQLLADAVRKVVAPLVEADVDDVLILDTHAALAEVLIHRAIGRARPLAWATAFAAELPVRFRLGQPSGALRLELALMGSRQEGEHAARMLGEWLCCPPPSVVAALLAPVERETTRVDVIMLLYAEFDRGAGALESYVAREATVRGLEGNALAVLRARRTRFGEVETSVEHIMQAGDWVGVSGVRSHAGAAVAFAHRWRLVEGRVVELVVDADECM